MNCPSFETLSAYSDGQAAREEAAALAAHLPSCRLCREVLAELDSAKRALRAYAVPPAPAGLAEDILAAAGLRPWWRRLADELSAGLLQPAGAVAAAAVLLAAVLALSGRRAAPELAEAPVEVPAEVLTAAHRRYALSMPLAPVESVPPPVWPRLAGGPEERDVY